LIKREMDLIGRINFLWFLILVLVALPQNELKALFFA